MWVAGLCEALLKGREGRGFCRIAPSLLGPSEKHVRPPPGQQDARSWLVDLKPGKVLSCNKVCRAVTYGLDTLARSVIWSPIQDYRTDFFRIHLVVGTSLYLSRLSYSHMGGSWQPISSSGLRCSLPSTARWCRCSDIRVLHTVSRAGIEARVGDRTVTGKSLGFQHRWDTLVFFHKWMSVHTCV